MSYPFVEKRSGSARLLTHKVCRSRDSYPAAAPARSLMLEVGFVSQKDVWGWRAESSVEIVEADLQLLVCC